MAITIYSDGLCEPNPGLGSWAFIAFDEKGNKLHHASGVIPGESTNNVAEYYGVGMALRWLSEAYPYEEVTIISDSQLVIHQISGQWACNSPKLKPLRERCVDYLNDLVVQFEWVESANNKADELTREAWRAKTGMFPPVRRKVK